ncbi:MAG: hypothetical protein Q4G68_14505, partial [Planctomycetia bacterium]|nr:hypothetical protein [Planctomycetia bacterium]
MQRIQRPTRSLRAAQPPGEGMAFPVPGMRRLRFRLSRLPLLVSGFVPVVLLCALVLALSGCGKSAPPSEPSPTPVAPPEAESGEEPDENAPLPPPSESAESILKRMVDLYAGAKVYSDQGYLETVYEVSVNGRKRMVSDRVPCEIALRKPNQVRLAVNSGLLVSDGHKLHGVIQEPGYQSQYYEREAPLLISAIKELYPDARLAGAMDLSVPSNILWVPPQLVLLLSKSPLRTFIPPGAEVTLGEPAWLVRDKGRTGMPNRVLCDRVLISSDDGTRTLWIGRDVPALLRFEFPLEQIAAPHNVERVLRLSIELPDLLVSADPQAVDLPPELFSLPGSASMHKVDRFEPVALLIAGKSAPPVTLRPLASGFSDVHWDDPGPGAKPRVVCLWKGAPDPVSGELEPDPVGNADHRLDPPAVTDYKTLTRMTSDVWAENKKFLTDLQSAWQFFTDREKLDCLTLNLDSLTDRSDSMVRAQYGEANVPFPLYRLRSLGNVSFEAQNNIPALLLIDGKGVVQRYCRAPLSLTRLDRDLHALANGDDLWKEEMAQFNRKTAQFDASLARADLSDCYATAQEQLAEDEIEILPKTTPDTFDMTRLWTVETLRSPGNPVVLPDASDSAKNVVVVPCEGNSLAMIDRTGTILKRVAPKAAQGEPITFVRVSGTRQQGSLAASAAGSSRKVHRLNPDFDDLGSLDVGQPRGQWVADCCFTPSDDPEHPLLVIALIGDLATSAIPVDGLYAVDFRKQDILWKDESVCSPTRIELASWREEEGGNTGDDAGDDAENADIENAD